MKHHKCDYCGFTAGWYQTEFNGKLICIECLNIIQLKKEKLDRPAYAGRGQESEPEVVGYADQSRPVTRVIEDTQLKIQYHG